MNSLRKLVSSLMLFFSVLSLTNAQDQLIKTNNDTIHCIVKEIGDLEIKYTKPDVSETIVFGIDKSDVLKIILANGNEINFNLAITDPEHYASDNKNTIKTNFLSPLFNHVNISYERSIRPGQSIEGSLGIIGVGNDVYNTDESGMFLKFGYKFIKSPDYYIRGQRYAHILKGAYIRPEIAFSSYSYDFEEIDWYTNTANISRETNVMFAFLLNFGKQWVIDNSFVVDTFIGVGYGFGTDDKNYGLHKGFIGGIEEFPMAISSGVRIGWCF